MEYSKASDTELKVSKEVEENVSLVALKNKKEALENSISTLEAELVEIDKQISECSKLGIVEVKEVEVEEVVAEE